MSDAGRKWTILLALISLLSVGLACALPSNQSPPPPALPASPAPGGAAPTAVPFSGVVVPGAEESLSPGNRFAPFPRVVDDAPSVPDQQALPENVDKEPFAQVLDEEQQERLLDQGFLLEARPFDSFAAVYAYGAKQKLPAYITADPVLHAFQVVIDVTWQRTQRRFLADDLQALGEAMVGASQQQWQAAEGDELPAQAAWRNMAFFAVGSSLLDPNFTAPPSVAEVVNEELTLIESGGRFLSPLFALERDYDRYRPRSYYADDETLASYFRAMTWYSQTMALDVEEEQAGRMSAAQGLLAAWAARSSGNLSRWERVYEPVLYFGGSVGARSLTEVLAAAEAVYGSQQEPSLLRDMARLDDFLATVRSLPPPVALDLQPAAAFAFMPQAQGSDAPVFREMVFNRVGTHQGSDAPGSTAVQTNIGLIRGLPRALDLPAALGSQMALARIEEAGDASYEGYQVQMEKLQEHFGQMAPAAWTGSLDGAWTFALQSLLAEDGHAWPPSVSGEGWQDRMFNSWYGGWVEMRHDTRLAPRPVRAVAQPPDAAIAYLEPQVVLYGRLASLAEQMVEGLGSRQLLEEEAGQKMRQMVRILRALEVMSRKELDGEPLTADETLLLGQLIIRLSNLATFEPGADSAATLTGAGLPRLIDVALEPSSGRLLQAGIGEAWPLYTLVPSREGPVLALGAVYSTYELLGEQIQGDTWLEMDNRPPPPPWLAPYLASQ